MRITNIALGLGLALSATLTGSAEANDPQPRLARCKFEDGSGQRQTCVWDAEHMGNGTGRSYLSITPRNGGDDVIVRISHRRAHRLGGF